MPNPLLPLALLVAFVAGLLHPSGAPSSEPRAHATDRPAQVARAVDTDPFRTHAWANYQGPQDMVWTPYQHATGARKQTLRYLALQPKAKWFGAWIPDSQIAAKVHDYISNAQAGNPEALVQMTVFRMVPWEHEACRRLPTRAEQASYKRWISRFAAAVGSTPTAIVLQPDGPFALCAPHGSTLPSQLVAYAARVLSGQPRTSVYVETGAADWPHAGSQGGVAAAVKILVRGGIRYARGFALASTHFDATTDEIARASGIAKALAAAGYPGRKAVINTSSNGHPLRVRAVHRPRPRQPGGLPEQHHPGGPHLHHPRHPTDRRCQRGPVEPAGRERPPGAAVRRRLPVDRPALALPQRLAVRDAARARPGAQHALALTDRDPPAAGPRGRPGVRGRWQDRSA